MRRVIFHIDVNSAFLSWIAIKILAEGGSDIRLVRDFAEPVRHLVFRPGAVVAAGRK